MPADGWPTNRGFVFVKTMTVSFHNFGASENTLFCDNNVNVKLPSDRKVTICFSNHVFVVAVTQIQ